MAKKPPADQKATPRFSDDRIADMIDARDAAGLTAALDTGLSPDWRDAAGRGLMHFAAAWNDAPAMENFSARGVALRSYDDNGRTPEDMARMMGHDGMAYKITQKLASMAADGAVIDTGFASLADIRRASSENLSDAFNALVQQGKLAGIIALARKDAQGLSASDFTGRDPDGDTTILKICQRGDLGKLMDVAAWKERPEEFRKLWSYVPQDYAAKHDADGFISSAHQARLQEYRQPDFRLGRRPPKGPKP